VRNIYGVNTSGKKSSNIFDATYKIGDIIEGKITFSNIDIVIMETSCEMQRKNNGQKKKTK
jgi:hypothetical protein